MKKYVLGIGNKEYTAELKSITVDEVDIIVNGKEYKVELKQFGRTKESVAKIRSASTQQAAPAAPVAQKAAPRPAGPAITGAGAVKAPLPGLILDIMVKENDTVKAGQNLLVMEAMKMENQVQAPHDGTIKKIFVNKGDSVAEEDPLVEIDRPFMTTL
ncbi:MAG: biotin/lipoyl-binding protein [bacterium]|nr:biotin/lipoyl-binding protein [bacterium]